MKLTKVDSICSRTGRDLQRYNVQGCRQVVGCIPYRYKQSPSINGTQVDDLEFLLVSSQKSPRMMFPKGGWEQDESLEEAALRETFEEAGIYGEVGSCLGNWFFKSKSLGVLHEGFMLPLIVLEELDDWPERDVRHRSWVSYREAMEVCFHPWMKEALNLLVSQLTLQQGGENEPRNGVVAEQILRNEEPRIEILACKKDIIEETRMGVKRKGDEPQLVIEILVSSESLQRNNEETRATTSCSIEFLRTEEPRMGIISSHTLHRNEEPRTSCSIEFLRIEEPRIGSIAQNAHEEEVDCFLVST